MAQLRLGHLRICSHSFVLAKQLLVFHSVYNVLLMLQYSYKFKHSTQNNDVVCNLIIRYVLVYNVV